MKRKLLIGLLCFLAPLLQTTLMSYVAVASIRPNLPVILTASFALMCGSRTGMIIGFSTGILLDLCDILHTTADKLLNGGSLAATERGVMKLEDVKKGFAYIEEIGRLFGEDSTIYQGMIEGINKKMNIDLLTYLKVPTTREVMYAEVLIQGILSGKTVDMDEIENSFNNRNMVETIRDYLGKTKD